MRQPVSVVLVSGARYLQLATELLQRMRLSSPTGGIWEAADVQWWSRHWTEHNIRVHVFTCVLALQIAHLMRRHATQAGLHLSVRELLSQLAGISETVLIYPSTGGRPKARRITTELTGNQQKLYEIFELSRHAPRS